MDRGSPSIDASDDSRPAQRHRNDAWTIALVLVLAVVATIRLRLLDVPLGRDEGEYAYFGQLLLEGIPPYATAYNFKIPGIYGVYAVILALFGPTPAGIHIGLLVANAAAIVLVFLLGARLFDPTAGLVAGAAYAALSLSPRLFAPAAYSEHFVLLPALGGVLLLLRAIDSRRLATVFWSGVLLGVAFVVKQSGGAFAVFAAAYLLLGADIPGGVRRRLILCVTLGVGALLPFGAVCLAMLLAGTFASFWFWTFTYASHYASATPIDKGMVYLGRALSTILPTSYLIVSVAGLGLSALVWDRVAATRRLFVALFLGFSFVATTAGLYFRNQYFILMLPALALLVGVAVAAANRACAGLRPPALRYAVTLALALIPILHLVYLERAILFRGTPHQIARALYGPNPFPEAQEIARYIRDRTSPEDRVAVVGSEPEIYFYARRPAATGYISTYPLMERHPYASAMQRHMISQIEAANPRFLVFVKVWSSWLVRPESDQTVFRWFEQYQKGFTRVGVVDIISSQTTRYAWGPEAAEYAPRSDIWLAVYERRDARPSTPLPPTPRQRGTP